MTVTSQVASVTIPGNGVMTLFAYNFLIPYLSDGVTPAAGVYYTDLLGNVILLATNQYSITGVGNSSGGTVTYNPGGVPIAVGTFLTIARQVPYTQPDSFPNQGFNPTSVEIALDNLELQIQQLVPNVPGTAPVSPNSNLIFLSRYTTLALADAAAVASGGTLILDKNYTLTGNTILSAKSVFGLGGIITLGTFNLTGSFTAASEVQMFNINSSGRVAGPSTGGGEVNCAWFGALDGTDSTTAINAAIAYARTTLGGAKNRKVVLNSGSYTISAQIILYDGVSFSGTGPEGTVLFCGGTFTGLTTSGLLRIGDGSGQVYGTVASGVALNLNNVANAIGLYTTDAQNGTGFAHIQVSNIAGGTGVWFNGDGGGAGFCNNYICDDIYLEKNNAANGGTALRIDGGTLPGHFTNVAIVAVGGGKFTYGYYFKNTVPIGSSLSIDGSSVLTGINVSTGCLYAGFNGITILNSNAVGINIEASITPVVVESYYYSGGGNALADAGGGTAAVKTIAGNVILPLYARNQTIWLNGSINSPPATAADPGVSGQLWFNTNVVTRSP